MKTLKTFIISGGKKIFVQIEYPKGIKEDKPRPAIIISHGLRSYYTGFLNMWGTALKKVGYIVVKFHFLGTGKSDGIFEDKTTAAMLQNYLDVVHFVNKRKEVRGIGVMARSNGGNLATIAGPIPEVKAYVFLAPDAYFSKGMEVFTQNAEIKDGYLYHKSFKRKHTNGPGRLPMTFIKEIEKFDDLILKNASRMKNVAFFQSEKDEAVRVIDGHFDYWKAHLPEPREIHYYKGGNHSFKGFKKIVIAAGVKWFKKWLPINK